MRNYAFINTEGSTLYTMSAADEAGIVSGEVYDGNLCLEIPKQPPPGEDVTYYVDKVYYDHDLKDWQTKPPCPGLEFYSWINKQWRFLPDKFLARIRATRDSKLAECDWTQMPDSALSTEQKAAWATYRQALRDFPSSITTESTLEELVWPTAP